MSAALMISSNTVRGANEPQLFYKTIKCFLSFFGLDHEVRNLLAARDQHLMRNFRRNVDRVARAERFLLASGDRCAASLSRRSAMSTYHRSTHDQRRFARNDIEYVGHFVVHFDFA